MLQYGITDQGKTSKGSLQEGQEGLYQLTGHRCWGGCEERSGKRLYQTTRLLSGRKPNLSKPISNRDGVILAKPDEQLARWEEHFEEVLNRPLPNNPTTLQKRIQLPVKTDGISKAEINSAFKSLKIGKGAGVGNIPREPFVWVVRYQSKHCTTFSTKSGGRRKSQMNGERDFSLSCQKRRYHLL